MKSPFVNTQFGARRCRICRTKNEPLLYVLADTLSKNSRIISILNLADFHGKYILGARRKKKCVSIFSQVGHLELLCAFSYSQTPRHSHFKELTIGRNKRACIFLAYECPKTCLGVKKGVPSIHPPEKRLWGQKSPDFCVNVHEVGRGRGGFIYKGCKNPHCGSSCIR
jgi:hypothetical protein